jgi:hypothetical protein
MTPSARAASHSVPLWPTLWVALALAAALALRFTVVEPREIGFACQALVPPWWCGVRQVLVLTFQWGAIGGLALVLGALGLINRSRGAALAAMILGAAALTLYNPETGAVGFLLGMLRALRP